MNTPEEEPHAIEEIIKSLNAFAYSIDLQTNVTLWNFGDIKSCLGYDPFKYGHDSFEFHPECLHPQDAVIMSERQDFFAKSLPGSWQGLFRVRQSNNKWTWIYSHIAISNHSGLRLNGIYYCGINGMQSPLQLNLLSQQLNENVNREKIALLSHQELKIVKLIAEGLTYNEIAAHLFISPQTVNRHKKNILNKLGFKNTAALVCWATHAGLT